MRLFPKTSVQGLTLHRSVYIHLLNLLDASPYWVPPSNVITWTAPLQANGVSVEELAITSSRVMLNLRCWEGFEDISTWSEGIFVWDWRTGDQVGLLRLEWSHSVHFASSGARPICGREYGGSRGY